MIIININDYKSLDKKINIKNEKYNDIHILKEKDYVTKPKDSGYSSYHIIVEIPIVLDGNTNYIKAEIQIRSLAMDFWASLEHTIKYKPNGDINENVAKELIQCANDINVLDDKMVEFFQK